MSIWSGIKTAAGGVKGFLDGLLADEQKVVDFYKNLKTVWAQLGGQTVKAASTVFYDGVKLVLAAEAEFAAVGSGNFPAIPGLTDTTVAATRAFIQSVKDGEKQAVADWEALGLPAITK